MKLDEQLEIHFPGCHKVHDDLLDICQFMAKEGWSIDQAGKFILMFTCKMFFDCAPSLDEGLDTMLETIKKAQAVYEVEPREPLDNITRH